MKITALLVLKSTGDGSESVFLANASDVSHFGYFQRSSVKEFILFVGRTVANRTPQGQRQSVQHQGFFNSIIFVPKFPYLRVSYYHAFSFDFNRVHTFYFTLSLTVFKHCNRKIY